MAGEDRYRKLFTVTWGQLHQDAKILARHLQEKMPFSGIIAVTRGGLVPAAIIARELEIRLIDTVCVASYQERSQGECANVLKKALADKEGEGWLIIDDLVDTGRTARFIRGMLPKAYFAAVYAKPEGRPLVDAFITEVSQETWILFPWDSEVQYAKPLVSCSS